MSLTPTIIFHENTGTPLFAVFVFTTGYTTIIITKDDTEPWMLIWTERHVSKTQGGFFAPSLKGMGVKSLLL